MDVILARAGLNSAQQLALCIGAVNDEVVQTEAKLKDALTALKRLRDVVRVTRDVHKSSTPLAMLAPHTETSAVRMVKLGRQINPLIERIYSGLGSSSVPPSYEASGPSTDEEEERGERLARLDWTIAQQRPAGRSSVAAPLSIRHTSSSPIVASPGRGFAAPPTPWRDPAQARMGDVLIDPVASTRLVSHSNSGSHVFGPHMQVGQKRRSCTAVENSFLRPSASEQLSDVCPMKVDVWDVGPQKNENRRESKRTAIHVHSNSASKPKEVHVVADLKRRLSQIPEEEHEDALFKSIRSALELAQLPMVTGEEVRVQEAVNFAREATEGLLKRDVGFTIVRNRHVEDVLQVLSVVVRAVLATKGKIEASGVRDLHELIKRVQNKFEDSSTRFQWCNTNMRKFITAHYKKLASVSIEDQNKLVAALDEVRGWKCSEDYSVSRFEGMMAVVRELLDGSYEEWQPCEDSRLAELLGLMSIRMGTFRDSAVQRTRQQEVNEWLSKMSGASFTPTLDLLSVPPPKTEDIYYEKCSTSAVEALLAFFPPAKRPRFEFPSSTVPSESQTDLSCNSVDKD
ncbi:uncharacterized protein KRP23_11771 [Phytophthora ramorum]|uniref:uncharacterized protein n=1 Tax=Phytophthora ramorum TaxID=164328 RepID=UPI0030A06BC7|nr:hypothetical protein KRP23_11771 [Phytophthora ramorum]